jgi:hypothetical protein
MNAGPGLTSNLLPRNILDVDESTEEEDDQSGVAGQRLGDAMSGLGSLADVAARELGLAADDRCSIASSTLPFGFDEDVLKDANNSNSGGNMLVVPGGVCDTTTLMADTDGVGSSTAINGNGLGLVAGMGRSCLSELSLPAGDGNHRSTEPVNIADSLVNIALTSSSAGGVSSSSTVFPPYCLSQVSSDDDVASCATAAMLLPDTLSCSEGGDDVVGTDMVAGLAAPAIYNVGSPPPTSTIGCDGGLLLTDDEVVTTTTTRMDFVESQDRAGSSSTDCDVSEEQSGLMICTDDQSSGTAGAIAGPQVGQSADED